jgi:hypothetical protein
MQYHRFIRHLSLVTVFILLSAVFQNCARHNFSTKHETQALKTDFGVKSNLGKTLAAFSIIKYEEYSSTSPIHSIDLNIDNSILTVNGSNNLQRSCSLDLLRVDKLKSILSSSQICKPQPIGEDQVVCLAISTTDIVLRNEDSSQHVELAKEMCNTGTFLCGDKDQMLREVLTDILHNPPLECALD